MKTLQIGNRIKLGGYSYIVNQTLYGYFIWLKGSQPSGQIFIDMGKDKYEYQEEVLGYIDKTSGVFPYCKTLEDLTKFVEAIKEELGEWELPEKWAVQRNEDNFRVLNAWCNSHEGVTGTSCSNGYVHSHNYGFWWEKMDGGHYYANVEGKHPDHTEITFEQFKKYVLKEPIMKEEFVLPEKWCVRHHQEVAEYIIKLLGSNKGNYFEDLEKFSHFPPSPTGRNFGGYCYRKKLDGYTEITFEQFKKYVLMKDSMYVKVINPGQEYTTHSHAREYGMTNYFYWTKGASRLSEGNVYKVVKEVEVNNYDPSFILLDEQTGYEYLISKKGCKIVEKPKEPKQQTMKKEIIGYKLKESCEQYKEAAKRVAANSMLFQNTRELYGYDFTARSQVKIDLEKTGVLDLWFEPVYKEVEELEVGDWVIVLPSDNNFSNYKKAIGYVFQIREDGTYYKDFISGRESVIDPTNKYRINYRLKDVRKATPEEIKEYKNNLLLEEAKKRYPLGCSYIGVNSSDGSPNGSKYTPTEIEPYWYGEGDTIALQSGKGLVYACGKWAEIIATPDITINGYKAEFHDTCVQFGCVKVDLEIINQIHNLIDNKSVDLTAERHKIKKIVEYYQNK